MTIPLMGLTWNLKGGPLEGIVIRQRPLLFRFQVSFPETVCVCVFFLASGFPQLVFLGTPLGLEGFRDLGV